jgi:transcriptional regulator with XRE-family HTH domain
MASRPVVEKVADGETFREFREKVGASSSETAFHTNIHPGLLSRFEHNTAYLTAAQRDRLAKYLRSEAVRKHKVLGKLVQSWQPSQQDRVAVGA